MYFDTSSLSTLQHTFSTIPIKRSRNRCRYTLFNVLAVIFLAKAITSSFLITVNRSFSFISYPTFSIQYSFAVKSNRTVAAEYLTLTMSFSNFMKCSHKSTIYSRCFFKTTIPPVWQAHSSRMRAILLWSVGVNGLCAIKQITGGKTLHLIRFIEKRSYKALSLKSCTISIKSLSTSLTNSKWSKDLTKIPRHSVISLDETMERRSLLL